MPSTKEVLNAPFPGSTPKLREYTAEQQALIKELRKVRLYQVTYNYRLTFSFPIVRSQLTIA